MKVGRLISMCCTVLLAAVTFGQHTPLTTQYLYNGLLINPAYAGSREALTADLSYRHQWVGFEGAPTTQVLSIHSPLNGKKMGLGLTVYNDRIGVSRETGVMSNYAYRMRMGNGKLALGLGVGLKMMQADWTAVRTVTPGDVEFATDSRGVLLPNFSAGAYYSTSRWFAGLSLPYFISQRHDAKSDRWEMDNNASQYQPMFTAGFLVDMDRDIKLKPSVLVRKASGEEVQADLNLNMIWKDRFWLGASYRMDDAVCFSLQVMPNKQFTVGYSYDMALNAISGYQHGTHEVMLQYEFGFEVKAKDPRYF
ncbi:MAG: type IX secretion system membrane protein PorP/SprF [Flavobacteriales bacterium]